MPEIQIQDDAGSAMTLFDLDGKLFPNFPEENLRGIRTFPLRPDDVLLCAYPKSGTHWVWEIIRILRAGRTDLEVVEKTIGCMDWLSQEHFETLVSPRTLNTHFRFSELPVDLTQQKLVFLTRNPKDVAVSLYNHVRNLQYFYHYDGTWSNFYNLFLNGLVEYGSWFDYTLHWEEAIESQPGENILTVMYEDLIQEPLKEMKRISQFLGKEYSDDFLEHVRDTCSFDHMKKMKGDINIGTDGKPVFYRKGGIGDWRKWFTVAQNEKFDAMHRKRMVNSDLVFKYT